VSNGILEELKREIGYARLEDNFGTVEKEMMDTTDRRVVLEGTKRGGGRNRSKKV